VSDQQDERVYPTQERVHEHPRKRLAKLGPKALSATDLLSVVIGSSKKAGGLIRQHGLSELAELPAKDWQKKDGVGPASAARLCAVFEIARRTYGVDAPGKHKRFVRPAEVNAEVRDIVPHKKEHLIGLYLDAQNGLIHRETLSIGSLNTTRTHPREILHPAVVHLAFGFILAHNHPSGSLDPSDEDIAFTRAVQRAGELMGIELYDHIIVAPAGYTSLRERGVF
jgi:DNA repair protein RadC